MPKNLFITIIYIRKINIYKEIIDFVAPRLIFFPLPLEKELVIPNNFH